MALLKAEFETNTGMRTDDLSDYLPYDSFDPKTGAFVSFQKDDPYVGFMFECSPMVIAGEEQHQAMMHILNANIPEGSVIQFILFADPRVRRVINIFKYLREEQPTSERIGKLLVEAGVLTEEQVEEIVEAQKVDGRRFGEAAEMLGYLDRLELQRHLERQKGISTIWAERYGDFILRHVESGFYSDVPVPVRNFRFFICIKVPSKDPAATLNDIASAVEDVRSNLETSYFHPIRLGPAGLADVAGWMLAPGSPELEEHPTEDAFDPQRPISDQILPGDFSLEWNPSLFGCSMKLRDRHLTVMSVKGFPKYVDLLDCANLAGDIMHYNLKQIRCPFFITLTVFKKSANPEVSFWAEHVFIQQPGQGSTSVKIRHKQKEADQALQAIEEEHETFYPFTMNVVLYSRDEKTRRQDSANVRALWEQRQFILKEEALYPLGYFLLSLPFGVRLNKSVLNFLKKKRALAPAGSIATLVPMQADWKGTGRVPAMIFVSRRGQAMLFDLFTGSDSNFNAVIYAESGAGKSFFTNYLLTCYHGLSAKQWVIDIGRSYEKICRFLGGRFIEFTFGADICLNPFTHTKSLDESIDSLVGLIERMARPRSGCGEEESLAIKEAVTIAWDKYGQEASITAVADILSTRGTEEGKQLAYLLSDYTTGGMYSKWFEGEANVDLASDDLIVLELEEIAQNTDLRNVILMLLMYQIQETAYTGDRMTRKLVLIDEAWQFFSDEHSGMARFIEHGFRRFRKYNGAFIVITQGLDDFYNESQVGQAIVNNSAHQIILRQKPEIIDMLAEQKKISFSEGLRNYLKSIRTIKGKYGEFYLRSGGGSGGIGRLFVDDFTYALFTSDGEKVQYINDLVSQGYSLVEAVSEAVRTNYGGSADPTGVKFTENWTEELMETARATLDKLPPAYRRDVFEAVRGSMLWHYNLYEMRKELEKERLKREGRL